MPYVEVPNGAQLRTRRERRGLRQADIADHLGVSRYLVGMWELGTRRITTPMLQQWEALLAQTADPLHALATWLVALDEPGNQERATVTMTQIINRARAALGTTEET